MLSPGIETEPSGHDEHVAIDTACTSIENIFTGHRGHSVLLVSFLYEPAAHDLQSLRPPPPKPALHRQLVTFLYAMLCSIAATSLSVARNCSR
jgi:hypothetical protein